MKEALRQLSGDGGQCEAQPVCDVLYGDDVPHLIVAYAKARRAQAIVLGVRRKSRVAAHMPPQRSYRIIMTAPCPVLTLSMESDSALSVASAGL